MLVDIFSSLALFLLVLDSTRTYQGGPLFAILCIMKPIFSMALSRYLWTKRMCCSTNPKRLSPHLFVQR
jgi:hypothetical protein